MKRHIAIYIVVAVLGIVAGAFATITTMDRLEQKGPLELRAVMRAEAPWTVSTRGDWGQLTLRGVPVVGARAEIDIPVPYAVRSAVLVDILTDDRAAGRLPRAALEGVVNGTSVGKPVAVEGDNGYRFLVPAAVLNKALPANVVLMFDRRDGSVLVNEIAVRETSRLTAFKGTVDACQGRRLAGWAVADGGGAPLTVVRNGRVVGEFLTSLERPDVAQAGFALHSGFEFVLDPPIKAGDIVDVRFPNGAAVSSPPCTP